VGWRPRAISGRPQPCCVVIGSNPQKGALPNAGTLFAPVTGMNRGRIIEPRTTWALSRRTTRRYFLLSPDQVRELEQCY